VCGKRAFSLLSPERKQLSCSYVHEKVFTTR
jgi:hypothetical protein